ncbi:MAG: A24 family peptidase [Desulfosudis oleivorans]|nr:A24 family peptidase [Desulfosudis oleivorans]
MVLRSTHQAPGQRAPAELPGAERQVPALRGVSISPRYLVELLNGVLYWTVIAVCPAGMPFSSLVSAMIVITFIDLDVQLIPDRITLPGIFIGLGGASFLLPDPFPLLTGISSAS